MKKNALLTVIVTVFLLLLAISTNIFAVDFSDVPSSHWASETIKAMSGKNIIVGYTDGTFKPEKEVQKVEVLVLFSRILGVNSPENADLVSQFEGKYKDALSKYETYAKREISYLLGKDILKQDELDLYIGNGNDEKIMTRLEVVSIVVRLMGKEQELSGKDFAVLTYKDAELIPQEKRVYVEYLGKEGLMASATDDNSFVPNGAITRAQIATLAYRVLNILEQNPVQEEPVQEEQDTKISGPIKSLSKDKSLRNIIVISTVIDGTAQEQSMFINREATVTINGEKSAISQIKVGDYAYIDTNEKGEAIDIITESKEKTITGIISKIDTENNSITVLVNDTETTYNVSNIEISKNDATSDIRSIRKGDNVVITMEYNTIKKVQLTSTQKNVRGKISEIIISKNPKITIIDYDNNIQTYDIGKDAQISIFNQKGDIYGLRLDCGVSLSLDSNEVIGIIEYKQVGGYVEAVVSKYGEITLSSNSSEIGSPLQLLVNSDTKYFNQKTQENISLADITAGKSIIAIGSYGKSSFYVSEVIVLE